LIPNSVDGSKASTAQAQGQVIATQVQPVVQQQLDALATQTFAWQGQVWPGQEMRWEIDEDAARHGPESEETAAKWTTRLNLTLPNLGEVAAQIRLQGDQVSLTISAGNADTRELIRASSLAFRRQLDEAGLTLASMGVDAATEGNVNGQAGQ
jgi:flagellar hook-length control protein FliK